METRHTIEESVFELSFDDLAPAAEFEAGLHDWLRQEVLPPFEALFDSLSGPDETLHVESLEIDLGDLPYRDWRRELPARLLEKLKAALEECVARQRGALAGGKGTADMPSPQSKTRHTDVQELLDFLAQGRLPWQASADRLAAHEHLLARVAQRDAAALLRGIAGSPLRATMVERLARQFPATCLLMLAERAAPAHGRLTAQLAELFPAGALPLFWKAVFDVLLDHVPDSARELAGRIVERFRATACHTSLESRRRPA